jgi:predicted NBD/HSP70 family sugar kinase
MRPAEQRIVEYASFSGWVDRVELAAALDLPAPTVTTAVRKLLAAGSLVAGDTDTGSGRAGRPRQRLRVAGPAPMTGLVSWSHDRLRLRLLDPSGDLVRELGRDQPVPDTGAHGLSPAVAELVAAAGQVADRRLAAVVVSVPAPFLRGTGTPVEHLGAEDDPRRFPVRSSAGAERALSEEHGIPVLLENDANLGALGELVHGAGAGVDFVHLTIGRHGFGSGVVVNGRLVRGARGYTGELAHLQMDHDGPLCTCGGRGCLWMQLRHLTAMQEGAPATTLDFADLPDRAVAGDAGAARLLRDVGRTIGRPLAQLCTMLDPHRLVLDGALGPAMDHLVRGIRESFSVDAPPAVADNIEVVVSPLRAADVLGACELPCEHARHA